MEEVRLVLFHARAIHRPEELTRKHSRAGQQVAIDISDDRDSFDFDVYFELRAFACMDGRKLIVPERRKDNLREHAQRRQPVYLYYR